jgi:small subunit ribosomal protein S9
MKQTDKEISERRNEMVNSMSNPLLKDSNNDPIEKVSRPSVWYGKGKRKTARAYAEIRPGTGKITVNGQEFNRYFNHPILRGKVTRPLNLTQTNCLYDIKLVVYGGGYTGQTDACLPAISKALIQINPEWTKILAENLMIKHDPRNVEAKKPGRIKARKGYVYNRR